MDKHKTESHLKHCNNTKKQYLIIFFMIAVVFLISEICFGTMVLSQKKLCPVCDTELTVMGVASYGSYIYNRESKFDLIFFPYDDPKLGSIYLCHHCGYAQVSRYFFDLKKRERAVLKEHLSVKWEPILRKDITPEIRLKQAIVVNKFLGKDEDFWAWFNRIQIYYYRKADPENAKSIASTELKLLQKSKGKFEFPGKNRTYLLGEYNRLLGNNDQARRYFRQALAVNAISSLKKANTFIILFLLTSFSLLLCATKTSTGSKILKLLCYIGPIVFIALFSIFLYIMPDIIQREVQLGNYYDEIITERIQLCNEQ